jgi:catechol 1,2-dioxygenase
MFTWISRNQSQIKSNILQVIAEGHKSVVTQIFDSDSGYLENDSVFAVKDGLTVKFVPRKGDPKAEWELEYNMSLSNES